MPKFEWISLNRVLTTTAGLAALALGAACGTGGSSTPVKVRTQGDKVDTALAKVFVGSYNRLDPANMEFAARLEGGSAVVEKLDRTDKVTTGEADFRMTIKLVVRRPGKDSDKAAVIAYSGALTPGKLAHLANREAKLMLASDQAYMVQAQCDSANCERVWALVAECDASTPKVEPTDAEKAKATAKAASVVKKAGTADVNCAGGTVRLLGMAFGPKSKPALLATPEARKAARAARAQVPQEAPVYGEYKIIWSGQVKTDAEDSGVKTAFAEALASRKAKGPEHDLEALAANQGGTPPPAEPPPAEETSEQKEARLKKEAEEAEALKKKAQEEEAAKKKAQEDEAAKKKAQEDEAARKKAEEEEAARLKKEEDEAAARKREEDAKAAAAAAATKP